MHYNTDFIFVNVCRWDYRRYDWCLSGIPKAWVVWMCYDAFWMCSWVVSFFLFHSLSQPTILPFLFFFFKLHCHWLLLQLPETCLIIYILYFIINKTDNDSFYFTGFIDYKQNKNKIIKQQWFLTVFLKSKIPEWK